LYEDVWFKGHTEMPEMLLLQKNMSQILAGESETMKQLDEDCDKIVERIVEGVKTEDYELCTKINKSFGSRILNGKMASIVAKVHSAGTLEDTLLLIKFSQQVHWISNSCVLIQALFEVLKAKNLLKTIHSMQLWAHSRGVEGQSNFLNVDASDREKCTSTCMELDKNKKLYFEIYQGYLENLDEEKIRALHKSNWHLESIMSEFLDYYYDGDLEKALFLLSAAKNGCYYLTRFQILNSLYKRMGYFDQLGTFEAFRIFTRVKHNLNCSPIDVLSKQEFQKLQAKAPTCLRLLLWPEPAGAKFRLINKFFDCPLVSSDSNVFCCLPKNQKDDQLWSAEIDPSTGLTSFKMQGKRMCFSFLTGKSTDDVGPTEDVTEWKIKAVDEHHIKLYFDGNSLFYFIVTRESSFVFKSFRKTVDWSDQLPGFKFQRCLPEEGEQLQFAVLES
jgi:hypothetical protein